MTLSIPFINNDNSPAASLMQRLSYLTETLLSYKTNKNRIVLSFKDSPGKPIRRRPNNLASGLEMKLPPSLSLFFGGWKRPRLAAAAGKRDIDGPHAARALNPLPPPPPHFARPISLRAFDRPRPREGGREKRERVLSGMNARV